MTKKDFINFCKREFETRGFKKHKKAFYLNGNNLLCGIHLQKSDYGDCFYVNCYYFIGEFEGVTNYPTYYENDVESRIIVMSKEETFQGEHFMTPMIEYEEYTEEELSAFFEKEFEEKILPPLCQGKKYILDNLNTLYFLTINQEEALRKLRL